ncbi:MAG: peptide chain release factor N(5)-glutamine methyltransferase, partial [Bradyrhizobium sp.]|uniref:peptide chain release factor N(5)-glutamine methyltransferase n=1 Tax=Bradyrhizobium sp. TaxID=376 RepID=UPI001D76C8C8
MSETIDGARRALAARLRKASIDCADLDARTLVGAVLGLDLTGLIAQGSRPLTAAEAARLDAFATRRLAGEPVARITGEKEFWGLPLKLSTATLVPRPDTETVVELALERLGGPGGRALRILDIATGSGAILLALLSELPGATGVGTDISEMAVRTARGNAADLGLMPRAAFVACDYAAALAAPFELIVSNPPYVRSSDISTLAPEVRDHDPRAALDGGADGLDAYRALVPAAERLLAAEGVLVVEAGQGQADEIEGLMTRSGLIVDGSP